MDIIYTFVYYDKLFAFPCPCAGNQIEAVTHARHTCLSHTPCTHARNIFQAHILGTHAVSLTDSNSHGILSLNVL